MHLHVQPSRHLPPTCMTCIYASASSCRDFQSHLHAKVLAKVSVHWKIHATCISLNSHTRVCNLEPRQHRFRCAFAIKERTSSPSHSRNRSSKVFVTVCPSQSWNTRIRSDVEKEVQLRLDPPRCWIGSITMIVQCHILQSEFYTIRPSLFHKGKGGSLRGHCKLHSNEMPLA